MVAKINCHDFLFMNNKSIKSNYILWKKLTGYFLKIDFHSTFWIKIIYFLRFLLDCESNLNYIIKGDYTYELKSYSVGSPAQIKIKNGTSASFDKTTKLINIPVFYTAKNAYLNDIEEQEIATFNCGDFITINNVTFSWTVGLRLFKRMI